MKKLFTLLFVITLSYNYSQSVKGNRTLAWQVDLAENGNYDSSLNYALDGCMESVHLFFTWYDLVSDTGVYNQSFITGFLDLINFYYPAYGLDVELQMATVNTVSRSVPNELNTIDFSSPLMLKHFKEALDTVFAHIPDLKLNALNIGNEPAVLWGIDSNKYNHYKVFIDSARLYAKQKYNAIHSEDLKVGVTFTQHALVDQNTAAHCKKVNTNMDIITTTYYPLENDFTMKPPTVVLGDFGDLVAEYPDTNQPIYFAECGYSSSSYCNSSELLQKQFYENVFAAWDTYQDNIKYLTIFKTNDWSQADVEALSTYYGISDTAFLEYLRTLGVRTYPGNGTNKLAYDAIKCELNARNWCATSCNTSSISTINSEDFIIYPNPSSNDITIETKNKIESIQVYDYNSRVVLSSKTKNLHLNSLDKGLYIINVLFKSGKEVNKQVIKQ